MLSQLHTSMFCAIDRQLYSTTNYSDLRWIISYWSLNCRPLYLYLWTLYRSSTACNPNWFIYFTPSKFFIIFFLICRCRLKAKGGSIWFSGSKPPSLSIRYLAIKKYLKKLPPQPYLIDKDENCYDQGCNDIGVVIATKWRYYLFYLQPYFPALGTVLPKSITGAFSSNSRLNVREVLSHI